MKPKDYNSIEWSNYFYLDETSPSGLRWKISRSGGSGGRKITSGAIAGTLQKTPVGKPKLWRVGLNGVFYVVHRIIYVLLNGSIRLDLVIDHLDGDGTNNTYQNLVLKSPRANQQNCRLASNNTSGFTGVYPSFTQKGDTIFYRWIARWSDKNSKTLSKSFSVNKFGYDAALAMAVDYRTSQIKLLNEAGQYYTDRHIYNKQDNK